MRGLHFQRPPAEAKLISCLSGRVKDIALDLRNGSPTYGKIYEIVLDRVNTMQYYYLRV